MEDIVLAPFDYAALDQSASDVRIRLDSTCVDVRNAPGTGVVAYMRGGALHRVEASHAVLACFHMVIPHIMPELAYEQRAALAQNVKTPICYTNVVVRNWRPWAALKISSITAPMSFHSGVSLDFPVSLGGYRHSRDPSEPMALHLVHVAGAPNRGLTAREQFHIGSARSANDIRDFETRFATSSIACWRGWLLECARHRGDHVNRWPHGYGYVENSLFDGR
jgi:spermidine dehydrogenase